jgi:cell wall-associated NlpC family hydrolase
VIATAMRLAGYGYQHHHVPDWDPPAGWPWKETCVGRNGKGVDCSNLTGFVYNQAFGVHLTSNVGRQAETAHCMKDGALHASLRRVELPESFQQRVKELRTGDLLYVRGRKDGPITHVVLWVGSIGRSREGAPLILDSHGSGVMDEDGVSIPCGVHLRPFREKSWYNRCASHAHRLFHESNE